MVKRYKLNLAASFPPIIRILLTITFLYGTVHFSILVRYGALFFILVHSFFLPSVEYP